MLVLNISNITVSDVEFIKKICGDWNFEMATKVIIFDKDTDSPSIYEMCVVNNICSCVLITKLGEKIKEQIDEIKKYLIETIQENIVSVRLANEMCFKVFFYIPNKEKVVINIDCEKTDAVMAPTIFMKMLKGMYEEYKHEFVFNNDYAPTHLVKKQPNSFPSFQTPSSNASYLPAQTSTYQPAQTSNYLPAQTSNYQPAQTSNYQPAQTSTYQPAQTSNYQPAQTSNYQPAQTSNYQPAQTSNYQPAQSTYQPAQTTGTPSYQSNYSTNKTAYNPVQGIGQGKGLGQWGNLSKTSDWGSGLKLGGQSGTNMWAPNVKK